MRLSDFAPRINGVIPAGMRGLGDLNTIISDNLIAYVNNPQGAVTPAEFAQTLQGQITGYCGTFQTACDPTTLANAQSAVQQYTAWYNGVPLQQQVNLTPATQNYLTGYGAAPPPGYQVNPYTGAIEPIPNALNTVAPTTTYIPPVAIPQNSLTPPVTSPPVTAGQVVNNQTQGGSQALANGTSGSNTDTTTSSMAWLTNPISASIPIPMWAALAGGLVALMMLKD